MAADFTQPIQDTPQDATPDATSAALDAQADVPDPNDPRLTSEPLDIKEGVDVYAFPPPPPDAKYRAKIKIVPQDDGKGGKVDAVPKIHKDGQLFYRHVVECSIIDHASGKYDGVKVYERWADTHVGPKGGSSVSTILDLLKKPDGTPWRTPGARLTHRDYSDLFIKALAGEPEVGIETQWDWSCPDCGKLAKEKSEPYPRSMRGMQKFPQDASASKPGHLVYQNEVQCQKVVAHGFSRAQIRIARFLPESAVRAK